MTKLYVGNLAYDVTEEDLSQVFEPFGSITSIALIKDRSTGRSKGFGFVEMAAKGEARVAITQLHGRELKGRTLTVNEARPRPEGFAGGARHGSGRRF